MFLNILGYLKSTYFGGYYIGGWPKSEILLNLAVIYPPK